MTFHHILPIQLRWNDTDVFGHVNNAVYFQFYDTAKTNYISTVCPNVDWRRWAIIMAHVEADFISPIMETDNVAIRTAVVRIGHKSFTLRQEAFDTATGDIRCRCISVMVLYNLEEHHSMLLPKEWVESINNFEKNLNI